MTGYLYHRTHRESSRQTDTETDVGPGSHSRCLDYDRPGARRKGPGVTDTSRRWGSVVPGNVSGRWETSSLWQDERSELFYPSFQGFWFGPFLSKTFPSILSLGPPTQCPPSSLRHGFLHRFVFWNTGLTIAHTTSHSHPSVRLIQFLPLLFFLFQRPGLQTHWVPRHRPITDQSCHPSLRRTSYLAVCLHHPSSGGCGRNPGGRGRPQVSVLNSPVASRRDREVQDREERVSVFLIGPG